MESVTLYSSPFRHSLPSNMGMKSYAAMIAVSLIIVTIYKTYALFWAGATFLKAQAAWNRTLLPFETFKKLYLKKTEAEAACVDAKNLYNQALATYKADTQAHSKAKADYDAAKEIFEQEGRNCTQAYPGKSPNELAQQVYEEANKRHISASQEASRLQQTLSQALKNMENARNAWATAKQIYETRQRLFQSAQEALKITCRQNETTLVKGKSLLEAEAVFFAVQANSSPTVRTICRFAQFFPIHLGIYNPA